MEATTDKKAPASSKSEKDVTEGAASLTPAESATKAQIAAGIDYTDTFTIADAIKSYNATRQDGFIRGEAVTAAAQRIERDAEWFKEHAGGFKLRQPSFYDELTIRARVGELTRGAPVDAMTESLCEATAVCELLLLEKPEWLNFNLLIDEIVPLMVYHWYVAWAKRFRRRG